MWCNLNVMPSIHSMYNKTWDVCFVYIDHNLQNQSTIWERLKTIYKKFQLSTLLIRDFNQVEYNSDKLGGSANIKGWDNFIKWKMKMDLLDIPFVGPKFTWSNEQFQGELRFE